VAGMFKGYSGYVQADAHAIFNVLFREGKDREQAATEVGCWSHARRYFWEAVICKEAKGVEGLKQIDKIFEEERAIKDQPPQQRQKIRQSKIKPLVDSYFEWVSKELSEVKFVGRLSKALGYSNNHKDALKTFLRDGRLKIDNNRSERALRDVAIGRKAWLFCGSNEHAESTGVILSLIGSCKLHRLDPEQYLEELMKVKPFWPRNRFLELTPKYWAQTRKRISENELNSLISEVTVPPTL